MQEVDRMFWCGGFLFCFFFGGGLFIVFVVVCLLAWLLALVWCFVVLVVVVVFAFCLGFLVVVIGLVFFSSIKLNTCIFHSLHRSLSRLQHVDLKTHCCTM